VETNKPIEIGLEGYMNNLDKQPMDELNNDARAFKLA
jgi:hypothetical protein